MNKYRLGERDKKTGLYRIVALLNFAGVKSGSIGGFVEGEENLDQSGNARVSDNAWVYG